MERPYQAVTAMISNARVGFPYKSVSQETISTFFAFKNKQ